MAPALHASGSRTATPPKRPRRARGYGRPGGSLGREPLTTRRGLGRQALPGTRSRGGAGGAAVAWPPPGRLTRDTRRTGPAWIAAPDLRPPSVGGGPMEKTNPKGARIAVLASSGIA